MSTAQPLHLVHPLLAMCERSIVLTALERSGLDELPFHVKALGAGDAPGWTGDRPARSFIVMEGTLATSKVLRVGEVQVTAFHIPGAVVGLMCLHLEVLDSDVAAITACKVAFVENADLRRLCEDHPCLAALLWRATVVDAAVASEWVVNIGQRDARSRLAHLYCEKMARMGAMGLVEDGSCALTLTQADLSEATGLSKVHVNRTPQKLRADGLIVFGQGRLSTPDWAALVRVADFRPDYLHLRGAPCPDTSSTSKAAQVPLTSQARS